MNIIGITGKSGSGKSYFSNKIGNELNNSRIINIDHIFFELLNKNETIKRQIIQIYGQEAYNRNGDIDLSIIQKDDKAFEKIYNACKEKLNERILTIISQAQKDKVENIVFDWFMLPKTIAFEKSALKVLVAPSDEDREKSLISRDPSYTSEAIKRRDSALPINYADYEYDEVIEHSYKEDMDSYIDSIKQQIYKLKEKDEEKRKEGESLRDSVKVDIPLEEQHNFAIQWVADNEKDSENEEVVRKPLSDDLIL